ncbi:uncharacterized protein JCM15063_002066 [Sporobolomyces koalae]|uniref:uncharacterized protein n=1 Tax=Sporobolomyces koalae TaxID=500713 RepID=UPI00317DA541
MALGVGDVAKTLYPRTVKKKPAELANVLRPWYKHDGKSRSREYTAEPFGSHHECFSPRANLLRGTTVRRAIVDVLRNERRVDESHRNGESLDRVLEFAMHASKSKGEAYFISPGLITAPDWELAEQYRQHGWKDPGIRWSSFRPSLLKITFVPANLTWRLEVVDIKSTQPSSVPNDPVRPVRAFFDPLFLTSSSPSQLFLSEIFKLEVYRYFLRLLVEELRDRDSFFDCLVISRTLSVWRYEGCFSRNCGEPYCILNSPGINSHHIEDALWIGESANTQWVETHLFTRIPRELGLAKATTTTATMKQITQEEAITNSLGSMRLV